MPNKITANRNPVTIATQTQYPAPRPPSPPELRQFRGHCVENPLKRYFPRSVYADTQSIGIQTQGSPEDAMLAIFQRSEEK